MHTHLDTVRTSASISCGERQKTLLKTKSRKARGSGASRVSGRLPVALPPVGPASPQAVCQSVCSFAYATEFSLAYPFPSLRSQILVFSPGESLPKLTFVFLFSCRIFNMSQTACKRSINVTFRIACWKSCICCPSGPWSWSFWLSHDSDLMCHCDLQWQYLAPRFKCLLKLLLECC